MIERHRSPGILALALGCWLVLVGAAAAQEADQDAATDSTALAKAAQNPLAAMVTLPLQTNFNAGTGPYDRTFFNLNVQPVVPFQGEKVNFIARAIIPVNSVPQGEIDSTFGIGDTTLTVFATPAKSGKFTWGIGPIVGLPTASNPEVLGSGKWGLGPSGVVFLQAGHWTMGAVASNLWSFAGDADRAHYNLFTAQYFVNYNLGKGWAIGTAPVLSSNWKAASGNRWTIPWGGQISKITRFGSQPVNLLLGYYTNRPHPDGGAESQVRFQINFLFPIASK